MCGGGLMQLVAYGMQDLGLNKFKWLSRKGKYNNFKIICNTECTASIIYRIL